MQTMADIIEKFYNKNKNEIIETLRKFNVDEDKWKLLFKGFIFSLRSKDKKKNEQRLMLYQRYLKKYNFSIRENETIYYIESLD